MAFSENHSVRPGYDQPLYVLPFDHRHSYVHEMFGFEPPLSSGQHEAVCDSKQLIYEGFLQAVASGVPISAAGILVDEEFGAAILRDAKQRGAATAVSTERSGSDEFEFEYDDWVAHLDAFEPTFAKALVRYNPDGDDASNQRQRDRLKQLSDHCRGGSQRFMFELLVPPNAVQLAEASGDKGVFDHSARPRLMERAIRELQDVGVEPDVWKIEGLSAATDCHRIVDIARRDGRDEVACIVLGRGADAGEVRHWLSVAADVPGFVGFAVGRTTFWDAVAGYRAGKLSRDAARTAIASKLREWVDIFEGRNP